jgi:hypothetical protein
LATSAKLFGFFATTAPKFRPIALVAQNADNHADRDRGPVARDPSHTT